MARLFEFSDQRWLPRTFRDLLTELLQHQIVAYGVYAPAVAKLNETLLRTATAEILDLCSGSGGPLPALAPYLLAGRIALSDRFPRRRGAPDDSRVRYLPDPVDARAVPPGIRACRTMFTGFHHFGARDARRILESAAEAGAPIAVFEFTDRRFARPSTLLTALWSAWRDSWSMRPRRWRRLLWTYLLPVVPAIYAWDCVVSHRRSYSAEELLALTRGIPGHFWEAGRLPGGDPRGGITYLVGVPSTEDPVRSGAPARSFGA